MLDREHVGRAMTSPLWLELVAAHGRAAAANQPVSNAVCAAVAEGSGSFAAGVAAAILSTGDRHAPFAAALEVLLGQRSARAIAFGGGTVPGFGNSFWKEGIDPAFVPVWNMLPRRRRDDLDHTTRLLHLAGKIVYPNAAIITAAVLAELNLGPEFGLVAFVLGRLPEWALAAALARE